MGRALLVLAFALLAAGRASAQDDHVNAPGTTATPVTVSGADMPGRIEVAGDRDCFRFTLATGTRVTVSTTALGAGMDTVLEVRAPSGALIGSNDDWNGTRASSYTFTSTTAGTFYAVVRHYAATGTGTYAVRVVGPATPTPTDDHPNVRVNTATVIPVGGMAMPGRIEVAGDRDWFQVSLTAGVRATVATSGLSSGMDTVLDVYTTGGTLLGSNDDFGGTRASSLTFTPTASGVHYVQVRHYAASGTGSYAVGAAAVAPPDDHPSALGPTTALVPVGGSVAGQIELPGDEDWFRFTVQAGGSYAVTATPAGAMYVNLAVYSPQGALLGSADGSGAFVARFTLQPATAGTYHARVTHVAPTGIGGYSVGVTAAAAARTLVFAPGPAASTAGQPISTFRVEVRDAAGLLVPTATNTITLTANVPLVAGATTVQAAGGAVTFSGLVTERAGTWTLTASSPGLTPASSTVQVATAPPVRMIVSTPTGVIQFGAPLPHVTVGYEDRFGNPWTTMAPDVSIDLAPNPGGAQLHGTLDQRANSGTALFRGLSVDRPAQGLRLVAKSAIGNLTGTSGAFDISPGPIGGLAFYRQPAGTEAGLEVSPLVRLTDAAGNYLVDAVVPVTIALAPGGGPGVLSGTLVRPTYSDAYALFRLSVSAPGTYQLVASVSSFQATSAPFTIVALAAPAGLTATGVGAARVELAWTLESLATTAIEVQRRPASGGAFAVVATLPPTARSHADTTAQPDRSYVYRVVSRSAAGASAPSATAAAATAPPAAGLTAVVRGTTRVDLSWTDASTTNPVYRLERSAAGRGQFARLGPDLAGTATVASDTTCEPGASYDYRVVAVGPGLLAPSAPVRVTTVPDAPAQAWAAGGPGQVVVSWAETRGADRYTVYRSPTAGVVPGGPGVVAIQGATSPLFLPATAGQTERFVVTATSTGGTSLASVEVGAAATAAGPSSAPTLHALGLVFGALRDLCVDRLRRRAYVVDGDELVVVDLTTEAALARLRLEPGAGSVSLSPNGRWLVVACAIQGHSSWRGGQPEAGVLCVIDPATLAVRRFPIALDPAQALALDAGVVHVAGGSNQQTAIRAYDLATGLERSWVGAYMHSALATSPDQRTLYAVDTSSPRGIRALPIGAFQDRDPAPIADGFTGLDGSPGSGGALVVDAAGSVGLLRSGELLTLVTGGRTDVAPVHLFPRLLQEPVAARTAGLFWGYDRVTQELVRVDASARATTASPGLGGLGAPSVVRLGPTGGTLLVATTDRRLVVQPLP